MPQVVDRHGEQSAQEIRSPVESSMSISRACGRSEISVRQRDQLVGGVAPCRDHRHHAAALLASGDDPRAARLMHAASATEVPPNFITTMSEVSSLMNG